MDQFQIENCCIQSTNPAFQSIDLLLAIPEHKVLLPPYGGHPSQNDVFALAKDRDGNLIALTVEGKVNESFGETLARWNSEKSLGKDKRLAFIQKTLGLTTATPPTVRYQLLHRTTSAITEAKRFNAQSAVMIVHSFSQNDLWFDDYAAFLNIFGVTQSSVGTLYFLTEVYGIKVYSGWARGEEKFLRA